MSDIAALNEAVQTRYRELTADYAEHYERRSVPDFREYDGVRVESLKIKLDPAGGTYTEQLDEGNPSYRTIELLSFDDLADQLAQRAVDFEREKLDGRGPGEVARVFLDSHPEPRVYAAVRPHVADQASESERRRIKFRHVFGVAQLVEA